MKKILIRADDLGYSEAVNLGIAKTVEAGLVKSVGIMVNMPTINHGLNLINPFDVCLGQHTNICLGPPVLDPKKIPSLCQSNGLFKTSTTYREAVKNGEDFVVLDEVIMEIEAQYHRFIELTGMKPDYFECHAVASKNFFKGLEIVAEKYKLSHLKMSMDETPVLFRNTKIYNRVPKDFAKYELNPISIIEETLATAHDGDCDMLIFHPGYIDAYLLKHSNMIKIRAFEAEMLSQPQTKTWIEAQNVTLVSYNDLK